MLAQLVKNPSTMQEMEETWVPIPGLGRSPEEWQPTPVFLLGESHGQRSLVGCSPQGCRESDTAEH